MRKIYPSIFKKFSFFAFILSALFILLTGSNVFGQNPRIFTASGSFTVPAGVTSITVEVWGAGGGGSTMTSNGYGGGGGGGAYAKSVITVTPNNTYSVVVGSGGAANLNGENSTFDGSAVVAAGGSGAGNNSTTGGAGGTVANSTGQTKYPGGNGADDYNGGWGGTSYSGGGGGGAGSTGAGNDAYRNNGGAAKASNGGAGGDGRSSTGNGYDGKIYGGGGGGGRRSYSGTKYGGSGANGYVVISWDPCSVPSITTQPATQTICTGGNVTFSVTAGGTAPLTYQWKKGGADISGATTSSYTKNGVSAADAANYSVYITNTCGDITSNNATLTVSTPAVITTDPVSQTKCAGQTANFSVTATGGPVTYQWQKNNVNISGATSANYTTPTLTAADNNTNYKVIVTSAGCGSVTSGVANLTVNSLGITTQPAAQTICTGSPVTFSVTASGTTPFTYQWKKGGANISGETSPTYTISSVAAGDAANYSVTVTNTCGTVTSNNALLTVGTTPAITTDPVSQIKCTGQSVTFSVAASGSPLSYQWRKGGVNIAGATSSTYTINTLAAADAADYDVVVTAATCGSVTSQKATLTVNASVSITTQPASQTICSGGPITFSVTATGTAPVTYQWRKGATDIGGATNATYSIATVSTADAATYSVVASNGCGSLTSGNAVLTVDIPPSISLQPVSQTLCTGQSVTFKVTAAGTSPTYQWRKGGVNISGANSATYTKPSLTTGDAGNYDVVVSVTNCSSATSTVATLTVNTPPAITTQPASQTICLGTSATFTITTTGTPAPTYQWKKNGTNISGATGTTYSISSVTAGDAATYTVVVSNTCSSVTSLNAILTTTSEGSWLGVTSTNWFTSTNWGCGIVPTATTDVTIPATAPNMPNINGAGAVSRDITINGTLTITGTNNLDVYGDWANNKTFTGTTSSVTFRGGTGNTIGGSVATTFGNLVVNKSATANTLTSITKAFTASNLTVTKGNLILTATDVSYSVGNITVPAAGILTDNVTWDNVHLLSVTGNIAIDGIFNYTSGAPHVNMNGAGNKTVRSGTNPASGFGFLTLSTGDYTANGQITVNANFWAMFGTGGSFTTGANTITANAGFLNAGGTVNINGGTVNVIGGVQVGYSNTAGTVNFSSGTINTDFLLVGQSNTGTFNHSGGTANINGNLTITTNGTYKATNSPIINITGNWSNSKTFTAGSSQVNFNGTAAQTIAGSSQTTFYNLSIANAAGVTLSQSTNVNGTLNLANGLFNTGGNVITMAAAGNITNASATRYINGKLGWIFSSNTSRTYPVGKSGNYRPVTFQYISRTNTSTVTVEQIEGSIGAPTAPVTAFTTRYWNISQSGGTNLNYKVTLSDPAFTPIGTAKIIKKEGNGTPAGFDAAAPNYTNVTGFTKFSGTNNGTNAFTLGYDCSSSANVGSSLVDFCQGDTTVPLGGSISGTATGGVWSSTAGGTFIPSATDLNARWAPPANYYGIATLKLTTTGGLCDNVSDTKTQKVIQGPTGTLTTLSTTICAGEAVTFTATAGTGYNYIFYINGIIAQSSDPKNTFSTTALQPGDVVTVAVANANNCGITLTAPAVTVNPLPVPTLSADKTTICPGETVTFTAGENGTSYAFKLNGAAAVTNTTGIYTNNTLNDGDTVTVVVTNGNGCKATSSKVTINVNAIPAGSLTSNPTPAKICAGDNITFTATSGFDKYEFFVNSIGQGVQTGVNNNIFSSTTLANPSVVKVTATNTSGCSTTFNAIGVTINPLPTGTITTTEASGPVNDYNICSGAKVTFTATSGFSNYKFYLRGTGSPVYDGPLNKYEPTDLVSGDYVTVVVTNNNGCISSTTIKSTTITVVPSPMGTLTVSPSATICADVQATFTADAGFDKYVFKINGVAKKTGTGFTFAPTAGSLNDGDLITVDVTNANSCVATFDTITMQVNALPSGTMTRAENSGNTPDDGIICAGAPVTFTAPTGFSTYNFLLNGSTAPGQDGTNVYTTSTLANNNTVTISVTNGSGCAAVLNTYTIKVNQLPAVSPITGITNVCVNSTTTLSDATAGGSWLSSDITTATIDGSGVVTGVKAGTVTITYTTVANGSGCTNSISTLVTVNALPTVAAITGGATRVCVGSTTPAFTDATSGGTWSTSDNSIATIDASGVVTGVAEGTVDIIYTTAADVNGCANSASKSLSVNALPIVTAIGGGATKVCIGATTLAFTDATPGGTWSVLNGTGAATITAAGILKGVTAGTVTVNYTLTNSNGCIITVSTGEITVNALPTPTLEGANPICINTTKTYTTEASQFNYDWTVVGGTVTGGGESTDNTITITWTSNGTKSVYVNYENENGCEAATSVTIGNGAISAPTITGDDIVCNNSDHVYSTETGNHDYSWVVNGGTITAGDDTEAVTVTWNVSGAKSISVNYALEGGCNAATPTKLNVTVRALPTATISGDATVCEGSTQPQIKFTGAGGTAPYTFTYTINGGSDLTITTVSGSSILLPVPTGTSGPFIYELKSVQDGNTVSCGNTASGTATVNVTPTPSATISYDGGPFCTTADPVDVTFGGTIGGTYSSTTGLSIDANSGTITPATSTAGTYTVTYTVAATGNCAVYTTTASVIITKAPSATISYAGGPYCTTASAVNVSFSGTGGGTYSSTTGLTIDAGTGTITPSSSTGGTYTVTYTVVADGGCELFSNTTDVTITQAPSATISYTGSPFCTTVSTTAVNFTGTTGGTFTVSPAGLTIDPSTGAINPSSSTAGNYTITYTVTSSGGCTSISPTASVVITAAPTAVAGDDLSTCSNSGAINFSSDATATDYSSVLWTSTGSGTFANANSLTTATYSPSAADIASGSVVLTLTANGNSGCTSVSSNKKLTISGIPTISILPISTTLCQGSIQALVATSTGTANTTIPKTFTSGNINLTIPDATGGWFGGPGEITTPITITGIPTNANITNISITLDVTHPNDGDLNFNLISKNGNILNLINRKGGSGDNFSGTTIAWHGGIDLPANGAPYSGIYKPDASYRIGEDHGWFGNDYRSNVTDFSNLLSSDINGNWQLYAEDVSKNDKGKINFWSITIEYEVPVSNPVTWSPQTDLYTDAGATTPYAGQSLTTVYAKPSSSGTKVYTATATNTNGCTNTAQATLTVEAAPDVKITADYCSVEGKVVLTATSTPTGTFRWDNGKTTDTIQVDESGSYSVTVSNGSGCKGYATISVAQELVINGDFEDGNINVNSDYTYHADPGCLGCGGTPADGVLVDDSGTNGYSITTNGRNVHKNFWGHDHTTGTGNFMAVNGHSDVIKVWKQTVNVLPNTKYYFSAWAMSLNHASPYAQLRFSVGNDLVGTTAVLGAGSENDSNNGWTRFYGDWTSGPNTTSVDIYINDLQPSPGGNDFGLDDISFGTLSTFINLVSAPGTDAQTPCVNTAITDIVYSAGSTASGPIVTGLPTGVTPSWNGVLLTISGTPTVAGNYTYTITTVASGSCKPTTVTGTITVRQDKITLSSGSASPSVCINTGVNIGFTLSGTAIDVVSDSTKIPAGFTGTLSGTTYTITGQSATPGSYPYTIVTSGGCTSDTIRGVITVTAQTITLDSDNNEQTVCINKAIDNIQYTVGGTGTGATVTDLPDGVTFEVNSGIIFITGTPTESGDFTYTVTTSGTCEAVTVQGIIHVTAAASVVLNSSAGTDGQSLCINTDITDITYSVTNATTADITGLPDGVSGSVSGGVFTITGKPTEAGAFTYTITTTEGCGIASISGTITVTSQTITLSNGSSSPTVCENSKLATDIIFTIGGTAGGASVSGLPDGMTGTLTGSIFTITGKPTENGTFDYIVTVTGSCATEATATGTITVSAAAIGGTVASTVVCGGTNGSLTLLDYSGTIDHWESTTDSTNGWTTISNNSITQAYNNILVPTSYRAAVKNGCGEVYSSTATIAIRNYWTGTVSDNWNTASNWSDNQVASTSCPDAYIPSGTPYEPILNNGVGVVNNLHIYTGAMLTVNGTGTLKVGGAITSSGGLDATYGTLEFNGTSPQTIAANTFVNNAVKDLIIGNTNGVSLNGPVDIYRSLNYNKNGATLNTNGNLTLKSTEDETAWIGDMTSHIIIGDVTVERYINVTKPGDGGHGKKWIFLATPTNGQSIFNSWMEGGNNSIPDYGVMLSGPGGDANGWDRPSQNPSIKVYDPSAPLGFTGASSSGIQLYNPKGWFVFVRGDRTVTGTNQEARNTTLRSKGTILSGLQPFSVNTPTPGFKSIGNPYPSAIDMRNILGQNESFYVWNPNIGGEYGYGAYQSYSYIGTDFVSIPGGQINNYVMSGQAFFAQTDLNYPNINIKETAKDNSSGSIVYFRPYGTVGAKGQTSQLRSNLYSSDATLQDGTLQIFDDKYSNGVDRFDARKMLNTGINFSVKVDNKLLVVERKQPIQQSDTIFFNLTGTANGKYKFQFLADNLSEHGLEAWLEDGFSGNRTPVQLQGTTDVSFDVTSAAASKAANRFRIVFKPQAAPLPVTFINVKAVKDGNDISVQWKVANEISINKYVVMKSTDGISFSDIASVKANDGKEYSSLDKNVVDGYNYYRIRSEDKNGELAYSAIVKVWAGNLVQSITVFPNPVVKGIINLKLENQPAGKYSVRLLNPIGQVILTRRFDHAGGNYSEKIPWDYKMAHGAYQMEVTKPDGGVKVIMIMY